MIPGAVIVAVISDRPEARGLAEARQMGFPAMAFDREGFASKIEMEQAIREALRQARPDLICLAGFMRLLSAGFVREFAGRILNIHPSLLPKFPGLEAQRRAIEAGETESGCTVHYVDEGVDTGAILVQKRVPILPADTAETLAARILQKEHEAYPEAVIIALSRLSGRPMPGA